MIESDYSLLEAPHHTLKEQVKVDPSPEHIPDEYEHIDNSNGKIYIFYDGCPDDFANIEKLVATLKSLKYVVKDENLFSYHKKEQVEENLKNIASDDHSETTCLIIIFYGTVERNDEFSFIDKSFITTREIWQHFTADKCEMLKNKPKLFFFQAKKVTELIETDAIRYEAGAYDVPAEADLLIVFKIIEGDNVFLSKFCDVLSYYGKRDDIITLLTCTEHDNNRPLIISTLTRKFYVTLSDKKSRGYHHEIQDHNTQINALINKMQVTLNEMKLCFAKNRIVKSNSFRLNRNPSVKSIRSEKLSQVDEKTNKEEQLNVDVIQKRSKTEINSKQSNKRNTIHGTVTNTASSTTHSANTLNRSISTRIEKKQRKLSTTSNSSRQKEERPPWR